MCACATAADRLTGTGFMWHICARPFWSTTLNLSEIFIKGTCVSEENPLTDQEPTPAAQKQEVATIDVTLLDRIIACLALIYPYSLLVDKMQQLLLDRVGTSVNNMLVLFSLIAFLLLVNAVAKKIYAWRQRKS
jgi:uncharacterized membrane protein